MPLTSFTTTPLTSFPFTNLPRTASVMFAQVDKVITGFIKTVYHYYDITYPADWGRGMWCCDHWYLQKLSHQSDILHQDIPARTGLSFSRACCGRLSRGYQTLGRQNISQNWQRGKTLQSFRLIFWRLIKEKIIKRAAPHEKWNLWTVASSKRNNDIITNRLCKLKNML